LSEPPAELKVYTMDAGYQESAHERRRGHGIGRGQAARGEGAAGERGEGAAGGPGGEPSGPDWYVPRLGLLPSSAQGFVACIDTPDNPMASFYSFPYRKKFWPGEIPVLRASRPILRRGGEWGRGEARNLVLALKLVARAFKQNSVELEVFKGVWGPVFFPSSPTAVDACSDPTLFAALKLPPAAAGKSHLTLEVPLGNWGDKAGGGGPGPWEVEPPSGITVRPIRPGHVGDLAAYYRLWSESGGLPLNPTGKAPRFGGWLDLRPWYSDVSSLLSHEAFILFAELKGEPIGLVHWWPNLYRLVARHGRGVMGAPASEAPGLTREAGEAKLFKLAISPKAGSNAGVVAGALFSTALSLMSREFGVRTAHVSLRPEDRPLERWLARLGGEAVQETVVLTFRA